MGRSSEVNEWPIWKMPEWMEQYRDSFQNTGGNPIEGLMNDSGTNINNNAVRTALIVAVDAPGQPSHAPA